MGKMKELYIHLENKANIIAAINRTEPEPILESMCHVFPAIDKNITYKFMQENESYKVKEDRITILYYMNKGNHIVKYEIYKYGKKTYEKKY